MRPAFRRVRAGQLVRDSPAGGGGGAPPGPASASLDSGVKEASRTRVSDTLGPGDQGHLQATEDWVQGPEEKGLLTAPGAGGPTREMWWPP